MEYEIWSEGYRATGEAAEAHYHGMFEADSFEDACRQVDGVDLNKDGTFRFPPSIWGCRFFNNEADARKSFG